MGPGGSSFADTVDPIDPDETATLRVRLAGDGMAGAAVEYENAGIGSLAASSATTSPLGETLVVYTAPSDPDGGTAPITATALGESDSLTITVERAIVVTVSPGSAALTAGATRQFTAAVANATNTGVTWSATGGTITQAGLYTAGSAPGTFTVTATSVEDPSRSASATVTITIGRPVLAGTLTRESIFGVITTHFEVFVRLEVAADGTITLLEASGSGDECCGEISCATAAGIVTVVGGASSATVTFDGTGQYLFAGPLRQTDELVLDTRTVQTELFHGPNSSFCADLQERTRIFEQTSVRFQNAQRVFEGGRLVAIDFTFVVPDGSLTQTGRLELET
jgi:hypothetical protein